MSAATFIPTTSVVENATKAGLFPGRRTAEVVENQRIAEGVYRLALRDGYIARTVKPGQFVNLYSPDPLKLLPRPFGVAQIEGDLVIVIFAVVGAGTAEFAGLGAGEAVDVLGPLGKAFDLDASANYLLVGGGLGVPPLLYAAQELAPRADASSAAVFGYRDERFADNLAQGFCESVFSITNEEGTVVDLLDSVEHAILAGERPTAILSCGPMPMMRAVAAWASRRALPSQLSLEARMSCGYGACVTCVVDTLDGRKKVCSDGPVFTPRQLGWE